MPIFINESPKKFMALINFKVMSGTINRLFRAHFPEIKKINHPYKIKEEHIINNLDAYESFIICRNPYDRLRSAYKDKCLIGKDKIIRIQYVHLRLLEILSKRRTISPYFKELAVGETDEKKIQKIIPILQSISLDEFVTIIKTMFDDNKVEHHFSTQIEIMERYLNINHTIKLEDIKDKWELINNITGKNLPFMHVHKTNLISNKFSKDSINIINHIYQGDFETFDYKIDL